MVLDVKDFYYLATENLDCNVCKMTILSYDDRILNQLPFGICVKFPAVLTYKYACDQAVVSLLRSRTLGNSPTTLQHKFLEVHSEEWLRRQAMYLHDCLLLGQPIPVYDNAGKLRAVPSAKWFLAAYIRDAWSRLAEIQATITSTVGTILKIDASKKICRKLQGLDANSASWVVNVGNEKGEILQSVATTSESIASLKMMANGWMLRFQKHDVEPPAVLYTDRDCCSDTGPSKYEVLFSGWNPHEDSFRYLAFHASYHSRMHIRVISSLWHFHGSSF